MIGRVHSIQSLGAVDGPGLRSVVFLQGCPLRCVYCHNPDTWDFQSGEEMESEELVKKLLRFRPYWGDRRVLKKWDRTAGGVTISGGEPLGQPEFVCDVFSRLQEAGVHTALDTSGMCDLKWAEKVLRVTDLALVDLKFLTEAEYERFCRGSLRRTERFLELTAELGVPVWVRHVAVPGMTADKEYLRAVKEKAEAFPNLERMEFLPFHNLCAEKYERLGILFPLSDTKVMEPEEWKELRDRVLGVSENI